MLSSLKHLFSYCVQYQSNLQDCYRFLGGDFCIFYRSFIYLWKSLFPLKSVLIILVFFIITALLHWREQMECGAVIYVIERKKAKMKSCSTLCNPMDCSPRLLCPWDSPGKNTGVGCHFLLQGIFPTQGLNPGLPICRQMLYCLSHQRSLGDI